MFLPARGIESFTVIGPDLRPVELIDEYLAWLSDCERSPNTVEAYAHDLRAFWTFLAERGLGWDQVGVLELGEFAAWARRPAENVLVLSEQAARRSASFQCGCKPTSTTQSAGSSHPMCSITPILDLACTDACMPILPRTSSGRYSRASKSAWNVTSVPSIKMGVCGRSVGQ